MRQDIRQFIQPDGQILAYRQRQGQIGSAQVMFLSGFRSDMDGTKAQALDDLAASLGFGLTRFDYFGHGQSSGDFSDGTIGRWRADTLAMLDERTDGPQILVGSSMGGWLALLAALARPDRVKALILIAPAPDFTEKLMWPSLDATARDQIMTHGYFAQASAYADAPTIITRQLIEEGRAHLILDRPINLHCPIRIVQGMKDPDVPWRHALSLVDSLAGPDVTLTLIKDGDHRLSRPQDLDILAQLLKDAITV